MTDRELLELAAKAAWIELDWNVTPRTNATSPQPVLAGNGATWNPITSDADAFRLAVKLNLFSAPSFYHFRSVERFGNERNDDCAATRRAIVRAAASIAKESKS